MYVALTNFISGQVLWEEKYWNGFMQRMWKHTNRYIEHTNRYRTMFQILEPGSWIPDPGSKIKL